MKASTDYHFETEILKFNQDSILEDIDRIINEHNPYKLYLNSTQKVRLLREIKDEKRSIKITFQGMTFYRNVLIAINFRLDDQSILITKKIITREIREPQ